jgi:hypothetical protein
MSHRRQPQESYKDLETLGHILQRIHKLQEKYWADGRDLRGKPLPRISRDYHDDVATIVCHPITLKDLDGLIKKSVRGNLQLNVGNLFMPPLDLDKSFVPVLSLECDYGCSPVTMRLCVGMFSFDQNHKPIVFAVRFETAHFSSNHDFHHGQFTREFERKSGASNGSSRTRKHVFASLPGWTPKHIPCIPVPADTPISLIICMLISFYGALIQSNISDLNIGAKHLEKPLAYLPKRK